MLNSDSELETLIDKLEEQIEIRKASLDEGLGFSLRNEDRSLEIHIFPKNTGENFQVIAKTHAERLENIIIQIFGEPLKVIQKDASIMDIAEFIVDLPNNHTKEEILSLTKKKFGIDESKLRFFTKMIIKQASRKNPREYLQQAAEKLQ